MSFDWQQIENGAFNWAMMPAELRPSWKRKSQHKDGSRKLAKDVNIEETLKVLEQKEKNKKVDGVPNQDETKESENVRYFVNICNEISCNESKTNKKKTI